MSETELLPCPFCGGSAGFVRVTRGFGVFAGCNLCQASVFAIDENNPSNIASHRKLAADAWNTRVDTIPRATVAAALRELRAEMTSMVVNLPAEFWVNRLDATIAKLGLETTYATTPEERERQQWEARRQWILAGGDSPTMKVDASLFVDTMPLAAPGLTDEAQEETAK